MSNHLEKELQKYTKTIESNPNDAVAYYNRGVTYSDLEQYEKALIDYTKAIELKPDYTDAYNNRGNAFGGLDRHEEALQDLNKAIELKQDFAFAYNNRGDTYNSLGQYDEALQDLNRAIELKPDFAFAYNNRGNAYLGLKQYEEALQDYNKAIELKQDYADAYYNKGLFYYRQDKNEEAITHLTEAIGLNNTSWRYYSLRSKAYTNLLKYEEAIDDLDKVLEIDPKNESAIAERSNLHTKIKESWIPTTSRFVAFFDIMGFKDFVQRNTEKVVFERLSELSKSARELFEGQTPENESSISSDKKYSYYIKVTTFSDSIILFTRDETKESLEAVLKCSQYLMHTATKLETPLKGAIAHGMISVSNDDKNPVFCGRPLNEAYELEEKLHYYGVVFHNSIDKFIYENETIIDEISNKHKDIWMEVETPLKEAGTVKHLNLNWFNSLGKVGFDKMINRFKTTSSGGVRKYIDNTVIVYEKISEEIKKKKTRSRP